MTVPDLNKLRAQVRGTIPPPTSLAPITRPIPTLPDPLLPFPERAEKFIEDWIEEKSPLFLPYLLSIAGLIGAVIGCIRGAQDNGIAGFFGGIFIGAIAGGFAVIFYGAILTWIVKKAARYMKIVLPIIGLIIAFNIIGAFSKP